MAFPPPGNTRFSLSTLTQRRGLAVLALASSAWMTPVAVRAGDSASLSSIAQREIQRRQQLVADADKQLAEAAKLNTEGKHEEAVSLLRRTYDSLPDSPIAAQAKARIASAYAAASCGRAMELLAQGRKKEAIEVLDDVNDIDPGNGDAAKLKSRANDPDRYPAALSPQHIENTAKVKALLVHAASAIDLGDYDKALADYQNVLRLDPYNIAARRGMETAEGHRAQYFDAARDQQRAKMIGIVDSQWEAAVPPASDISAQMGASMGTKVESTLSLREQLEKKLRTMIVARAEFNGATLEEAVEFLRVQSRNLDPKGISFVLNVDEATRQKPVSLNLQNVPMEELIRYVTQMSASAYRVEDNAIVIVSLTERSTNLITKTYHVPPDFLQTADVSAAPAAADPFAPAGGKAGAPASSLMRRMGAKEFLQSRGVVFPESGGASFSAATGTLIVRTTADQIAMVDLFVEQAMGATPRMASIVVKMISISQEAFNEIGFDVGLGQANLPGSNRIFASGGTPSSGSVNFKSDDVAGQSPISAQALMTAGLRSSGPLLSAPGIDELIRRNGDTPMASSTSPAQFALRGVFTDPQVDLIVRNLSQSKGADVTAVPSVVAKSGQKASVRVVREFPYPTEYDPPQIPQSVGTYTIGNTRYNTGNPSAPITPATPTAFEKKEVGVTLDVEPNISSDGKSVEIALTPSMVDFEGFIDYGSDITQSVYNTGLAAITQGNLLLFFFGNIFVGNYTQPNDILQPIFKKVSSTTAVKIYDGATVVIGGILDERMTQMNDKVPLVGDIPLAGRLWQSQVKSGKKRAVLFFVTVNVIDPSGQRVNQATAAQ